MSIFKTILERAKNSGVSLECFDRKGDRVQSSNGEDLLETVRRYRTAFCGWETRSYQGHKTIGLFFKSEETIEFLIAAFSAIAEGFTVVPFYPNWDAETQLEYLQKYQIRSIAVGNGFLSRVKQWEGNGSIEKIVPIRLEERPPLLRSTDPIFPEDLPEDHPCAWIFTSGTSGEVPKCTVIDQRNIRAAVEAIEALDFIKPGLTLHSPLSTSHIFAFVVVLGILATQPSRLIFSDVQYLARLDESKIGKIDGLILVPMVLNRMRSGFYEMLMGNGKKKDPKLEKIPMPVRTGLSRLLRFSEQGMIDMEKGRLQGFLKWPAIQMIRSIFSSKIKKRLGSPRFIVVGGAKPNQHSMAFVDVMGIRCLQGWGMTETTGPLAVCTLNDRFKGAFGTCGGLFNETQARLEDGELIVEGPQIAQGYLEPDGTFIAFNGIKRTGDYAEFDSRGRLMVTGKVSDRITLANGLNYNPLLIEEVILQEDLKLQQLIEECVVIGDGQSKLGAVFFLKEPSDTPEVKEYLQNLLDEINQTLPIDEQIGPWDIVPQVLKESPFLGPSGKIRRPIVERAFSLIYRESESVPV